MESISLNQTNIVSGALAVALLVAASVLLGTLIAQKASWALWKRSSTGWIGTRAGIWTSRN